MNGYLLHNDVQFSLGRNLVFYQVQFDEPFEPSQLARSVLEVVESLGITSYAAYETIGEFDLLLRCWVPQAIHPQVVCDSILDRARSRIRTVRGIPVSDILFHWPWLSEDGGSYYHPPENAMKWDSDYAVRLNRTLTAEPGGLDDDEIDDALAAHLIAPIASNVLEHHADIKFVILLASVAGGGSGGGVQERRMVSAALRETFAALPAANSATSGGSALAQLSLYETRGSDVAAFVLMGRLASQQYYEGLQLVFEKLTETGFRSYFRLRPYTYLTASPGFIELRDTVPVATAPEQSWIVNDATELLDLLERDESSTLEFKGSIYVQVRSWLLDGSLEASEDLFTSGVVREVAAFLNSPAGGVLVLGALERDRELSRVPATSRDAAERRLDELPRVADKVLTGVELDAEAKSLFADLDKASRHLMQKLRSGLEAPSLAGLVRVTFHDVRERTVCVVEVRPLPSNGGWAYIRGESELPVRDGAETRRLLGRQADEHRARRDE